MRGLGLGTYSWESTISGYGCGSLQFGACSWDPTSLGLRIWKPAVGRLQWGAYNLEPRIFAGQIPGLAPHTPHPGTALRSLCCLVEATPGRPPGLLQHCWRLLLVVNVDWIDIATVFRKRVHNSNIHPRANPRAKANGLLGSRPVISNAPGSKVSFPAPTQKGFLYKASTE